VFFSCSNNRNNNLQRSKISAETVKVKGMKALKEMEEQIMNQLKKQ
jgi:hypothetical protein